MLDGNMSAAAATAGAVSETFAFFRWDRGEFEDNSWCSWASGQLNAQPTS
jgi:hypothetical protein